MKARAICWTTSSVGLGDGCICPEQVYYSAASHVVYIGYPYIAVDLVVIY
jgi:hypothetical protein